MKKIVIDCPESENICEYCGSIMTYDPKFNIHACFDRDCIINNSVKNNDK